MILSGSVNAHPHKSGDIAHGLSLEKYQIDLVFTSDDSTEVMEDLSMKIVKNNKRQKSNNIQKKTNVKKIDHEKIIKKDNHHKQKKH